jgi:hypothetical protein
MDMTKLIVAFRYSSNGPKGYIFLVECIYVCSCDLTIPNCYLTLGLTFSAVGAPGTEGLVELKTAPL